MAGFVVSGALLEKRRDHMLCVGPRLRGTQANQGLNVANIVQAVLASGLPETPNARALEGTGRRHSLVAGDRYETCDRFATRARFG